MVGGTAYPVPLFPTPITLIPLYAVCIAQVADAPDPPPPLITIDGEIEYPAPAFVNTISLIE